MKKRTGNEFEPDPDDTNDEDILTSEEALAKATSMLADARKPKTMTRIDEQEVKLLAALVTLGFHYDIDILKNVCRNFMELRISLKGLGRQELLEIAKSAREEKMETSRLKKLLTLGGRL